VDLPSDVLGRHAICLVSGATLPLEVKQRRATVHIRSVLDHEVLVVS
jgi:hypothetical protein